MGIVGCLVRVELGKLQRDEGEEDEQSTLSLGRRSDLRLAASETVLAKGSFKVSVDSDGSFLAP